MKFRLLNTVTGWLTFIIAFVVYALTVEPTVSFWDCGEFIATATKLEVGHPPGAPLFMLIARVFSMFAGGNPLLVAKSINMLSVVSSALTIMFLYWTITYFAERFIKNADEKSLGGKIAIIGSGLVGALAYTFSDSFWFSAVEAEVYATSSLFTAIVFWAILKWERVAHQEYSNRWLILIAYLMGLSIGVHLLNLLVIPAIVFVYYLKKNVFSVKGLILSLALSVVIVGFIMYGIIPGIAKIAFLFDLLFVNTFNMPFNSGALFFVTALFATLIFLIYFTYKRKKVVLNTIFLAFTFLVIGYSSYMLIIIRSNANPPIDQNNPDNVYSLLYYLNREQYGDSPLFLGENFNSKLDSKDPFSEGKALYVKKDGKYVVTGHSTVPNYDSKMTALFPRMYSPRAEHVREYNKWIKVSGRTFTETDREGNQKEFTIPSFSDNIGFFLKYQVSHMYFRYFMWNFAGRQNDIQGHGDNLSGNWITGIPFVDDIRLGDQDQLTDTLKNNKANNKLYMLPLILGIIGLVFQLNRKKNDFWVVMLLFVFTGLAIVVYLNQYPLQPRERDYAYVGSFYAFAIWIGLGVFAIIESVRKINIPHAAAGIGVTAISLALVPGIMASENWDDHNRSDRYLARDMGVNYVKTCDKDAIVFSSGDNDTFSLWYMQEAEGKRKDIRVACTPYLSMDWYVDQMQVKMHDSDPLKMAFTKDKYEQDKRNSVFVLPDQRIKGYTDLSKILDFVMLDKKESQVQASSGYVNYFPTNKISIPVDKEKVLRNGIVSIKDTSKIVDQLEFVIKKDQLIKSQLMILDIIASNDWERPIYFTSLVEPRNLGLTDYIQLEGMIYKLVPIKSKDTPYRLGGINVDEMYKNVMDSLQWQGKVTEKMFLDDVSERTLRSVRSNYYNLAIELFNQNETEKAMNVINKSDEIVPVDVVHVEIYNLPVLEKLFEVNEDEKALIMFNQLAEDEYQKIEMYLYMDTRDNEDYSEKIGRSYSILRELGRIATVYKKDDLLQEINSKLMIISRLIQEQES